MILQVYLKQKMLYKNWFSYLGWHFDLEFAIDNEREFDKPFIDDYMKKLISNCADFSISHNETLNEFGSILKKEE